MAFGKIWAGKIYGTNTGNIFIKLDGADAELKGTLHHSDPDAGISIYEISGSFDGTRVSFEGTVQKPVEGAIYGKLKATGTLQPSGSIEGQWETEIGSAGTFILFPHDRSSGDIEKPPSPDQLHTARHTFGPVEIDRAQITALADEIQRSLPKARVVVTFVSGTEQSRYLSDFKTLDIIPERAELVKLFARDQETGDADRSITVEFGQSINWAMVQSANEAWALGELEKLKRGIKRYERFYAARQYGAGINQMMIGGAIVFLPSLSSLLDRAILAAGVLALIFCVNWIHKNYLPHAAIYLSTKKDGWLSRVAPSAASWLIGIAASVIATLLGAYLKGWLSLSL